MEYGYIRHSPSLPLHDTQLVDLHLPTESLYVDLCSIKEDRPARDRLLKDVRPGDVVYVQSIDRVARNVKDLLYFIKEMLDKNVEVHFVSEKLTVSLNGGDARAAETIVNTLGVLTIWERTLLRELQEEGKAAARLAGKHFGRPTTVTEAQRREVRRLLLEDNKKSVLQISRETGVPRTTCYRIKEKIEREFSPKKS